VIAQRDRSQNRFDIRVRRTAIGVPVEPLVLMVPTAPCSAARPAVECRARLLDLAPGYERNAPQASGFDVAPLPSPSSRSR